MSIPDPDSPEEGPERNEDASFNDDALYDGYEQVSLSFRDEIKAVSGRLDFFAMFLSALVIGLFAVVVSIVLYLLTDRSSTIGKLTEKMEKLTTERTDFVKEKKDNQIDILLRHVDLLRDVSEIQKQMLRSTPGQLKSVTTPKITNSIPHTQINKQQKPVNPVTVNINNNYPMNQAPKKTVTPNSSMQQNSWKPVDITGSVGETTIRVDTSEKIFKEIFSQE